MVSRIAAPTRGRRAPRSVLSGQEWSSCRGIRSWLLKYPVLLLLLRLFSSSVAPAESHHEPFRRAQVLEDGVDFVRESSIPYTILRPGRLTDGPYTSYLNTLLKATAGQRQAVIIGQGDKLIGEASCFVVAKACTQMLDIEFTEGETYEISSVEDITGREYLHVDNPSSSSKFDLLADPYTTSG